MTNAPHFENATIDDVLAADTLVAATDVIELESLATYAGFIAHLPNDEIIDALCAFSVIITPLDD